MTRTTNARVAGVAFLVYIAVTIAGIFLYTSATAGNGVAAQLEGIARHATEFRVTIVLGLIGSLCALVLAATLYSLTREQDRDLAMLAMICRVAEGVGGTDVSNTLGLLWLSARNDAIAIDANAAAALGAYFLKAGTAFTASAAFFAIGSTLFSWLLLRGRMIPATLAWFGVLASILPALLFPLQLAGLLAGALPSLMWYPVLVFELILAVWLITKGVRAPPAAASAIG